MHELRLRSHLATVEGIASSAGDPFDALGDPHRRAIVELLGAGERSVQEIADRLPISRPSVSRHLRLLTNAGLVVAEPRGTRRLYSLHDEDVEAVRTYLEQVWGGSVRRREAGALDAEHALRDGAQALRGDRPATVVTDAVAARLELGQCTRHARLGDLEAPPDADVGEAADRLGGAVADALAEREVGPALWRLGQPREPFAQVPLLEQQLALDEGEVGHQSASL